MRKKIITLLLAITVIGMYTFGSMASAFATEDTNTAGSGSAGTGTETTQPTTNTNSNESTGKQTQTNTSTPSSNSNTNSENNSENAAQPVAESIAITEDNISLAIDDTKELTTKVTPSMAEGETIVWSSDNEKVATVSAGKVTAIAFGTATITAKLMSADGNTVVATATSTVKVDTYHHKDSKGTPDYDVTIVLTGENEGSATVRILESKSDDLTLDMEDIILNVNKAFDDLELPGDGKYVTVTVISSSGTKYVYKNGSFSLSDKVGKAPATESDMSSSSLKYYDTSAGTNLYYFNYLPSITKSNAIKALVGNTNDTFTYSDLISLCNSLAAKNYSGPDALADYLLDYYNVKSFDELTADQIQDLMSGTRFNEELSISQIMKIYRNATDSSIVDNTLNFSNAGNNYEVKVMPIGDKAMTFYYNYYNSKLLQFGYGSDYNSLVSNIKAGDLGEKGITNSIADYMNDTNKISTNQDSFFANLFSGTFDSSNTTGTTFSLGYYIQGDRTKNSYMDYSYSFNNTIVLTPYVEPTPTPTPTPFTQSTTYTVVANYYTSTDKGTTYTKDNSEAVTVKDATKVNVGDTITASPETTWVTYNGNAYNIDESKSEMTKTAVLDPATNVLTVNYYRITGSNNNGGNNNNSSNNNNNNNNNNSNTGKTTNTSDNNNSNNPDTGDHSNMILWSSVGAAGILLAGIMFGLRKREDDEKANN